MGRTRVKKVMEIRGLNWIIGKSLSVIVTNILGIGRGTT